MKTIYNILFYLIMTVIIWVNIKCEEDSTTIYGVIFHYSLQVVTPLFYEYTPMDQKLGRKATLISTKERIPGNVKLSYGQNLEIDTIVEELMRRKKLKSIPMDRIFIKLFYDPYDKIYNPKLMLDQKLNDAAAKIVNKYYTIPNEPSVEILDQKRENNLIFSYTNIQSTEETLTPSITLIFKKHKLFIGFITPNPEKFPKELIQQGKYKSHEFTLFAASFLCASLSEINYLIYEELIKESTNTNEIAHACMPLNHVVTIEPDKIKSICVKEFKYTTKVDFVGTNNKEECQKLVEKVINKKGLDVDPLKRRNFSGLSLPLSIDSKIDLVLYTNLIKVDAKQGNFHFELKKAQDRLCQGSAERIATDEEDISCSKILYLKFILENIVSYADRKVIINNSEHPEYITNILPYCDPRVGLVLDKEFGTLKGGYF